MDNHLTPLPRVEPASADRMRAVAPGLWACAEEPLGGPANTCGYLLQREAGNVFVYSSSKFDRIADHIEELGGVDTILLNHMDEATSHVTRMAKHFGATVHTHVEEVEACTERGVEDIDPIDGDHRFGDDLEAIHAPGHTRGTTAYRWENPADGKVYLFTGDTFSNFTVDRFESVLRFHPYDGERDDIRRTLARLREVHSDVLVPGLANGQIDAFSWTTEERQALLDHAAAQLDG